jgi:hypothetical protein
VQEQKFNSEQKVDDTKSSQPIAKPHVSSIVPLSYEEQCNLFDKRFGRLDCSSILNHEEYITHRDFLIQSGYFAFLISRFSD